MLPSPTPSSTRRAGASGSCRSAWGFAVKLEGKVAIITGADSGIGQAMAEAFAREGADIVIGFNTDADGARDTEDRVARAGRRGHTVQVDVGDPASVRAMFEAAVATFRA